MTDEETLMLGAYCDDLMQNETFGRLVHLAELSAFQSFQNTTPADTKAREQAYSEYQGLRNFLGMMTAIVERRDYMLEQAQLNKTAPSDDGQE